MEDYEGTGSMSIATWASDQNPREAREYNSAFTQRSDMALSLSTVNKSVDSFEGQVAHIDRNLHSGCDLAYPNLDKKSVDTTKMPPPTNRPSCAAETRPNVGPTGASESVLDYTASLELALQENDEEAVRALLDRAFQSDCQTPNIAHGLAAGVHTVPPTAQIHLPGQGHVYQPHHEPSTLTAETSFDAAVARIDQAMHENDSDTVDVQQSSFAYPNLVGPRRGSSTPGFVLPSQYSVGHPSQQQNESGLSIDIFQSTDSTVSVLSGLSAMSLDQSSPMPDRIVPTEQDVIMYRSDHFLTQDHMGNRLFQREFSVRHARYARSKSEPEKLAIRQELLQHMKVVGGRFLVQHPNGDMELMRAAEIEQKLWSDFGQKCFVDDVKLDFDIRLGRGGHCTSDPGHQRFLNQKDEMRVAYKAAGTNVQIKGQIAQDLVDWVYASGGRFLKEYNNQWYIVDNDAALHKAKQALRTARKRQVEG